MTRNLKMLGIALVAALAVCAAGASAASATAFQFHSETGPTTLSGQNHAGNEKFVVDAGTIECATATYSGTVSVATTSSITVTPTYSSCIFAGTALTLDMNGCGYLFTAKTIESGNREGTLDMECPAGNRIEVTAFGCTITFPAQNGLGKVTFTNVGAGKTREVTFDVNLAGINYEEHNKGIFPTCKNNTVATTNGTHTGSTLLTGSGGGVHSGFFTG